MKKYFLATTFLLLCTGFALAQAYPSSNPSSTSSGTQTQTAPDQKQTQTPPDQMSQPSQSTTPSTSSQMGTQTASKNKGEKEKAVTGCLESAGAAGQYTVKHKNKEIAVIPSDAVKSEISNHVGHQVKLYGTWEAGAAGTETAMNQPSSTLPQSDQPGGTKGMAKTEAGKNFRVDRIEMVSDTCGGKSKSDQSGTTTPKPY